MFDARSFALNAAFISLLFALIVFAFHLSIGRLRHTRWWATGNLAVSVGLGLLLLQGSAPAWLGFNLANALLTFGLVSYVVAIKYLAGEKPPVGILASIMLGQILGFVCLTQIVDLSAMRVMVMSLLSGAICVWVGLFSKALVKLTRSPVPVRIMQLVFLVFGASSLLRCALAAFSPTSSAFSASSAADLFYLLMQVLIVGSTLGLMLIHNQILAREVEERQARLVALNRNRERMLSVLGHDLVGGVGNLRLLGDNLRNTANHIDADTLRSLGGLVISSSDRLLSILRSLVEWSSSLRSGKAEFLVPSVLGRLVDHAIDQVRSEAAAKDISIRYQEAPSPQFMANHGALETVLRNLLANAVKFTPRGGSVEISASADIDWFHLDVRDSGTGMDTDKVAAFRRGEDLSSSPGSAGEKGFGLGLGLCRDLMAEQGGRLTILDSAPGLGTCFRLSLRLAK